MSLSGPAQRGPPARAPSQLARGPSVKSGTFARQSGTCARMTGSVWSRTAHTAGGVSGMRCTSVPSALRTAHETAAATLRIGTSPAHHLLLEVPSTDRDPSAEGAAICSACAAESPRVLAGARLDAGTVMTNPPPGACRPPLARSPDSSSGRPSPDGQLVHEYLVVHGSISAHRPLHTGVRFSRNARLPSAASSVPWSRSWMASTRSW